MRECDKISNRINIFQSRQILPDFKGVEFDWFRNNSNRVGR